MAKRATKRLAAFGMLRRGLTVSPAAIAMSSGEVMNANPALITACQYARNLPVTPGAMYSLKAPGWSQYLKPSRSWFGPPPKKSTTPRMISPIMVISLILANQNSASPKNDTAMTFNSKIMTKTMVIQTATLTGAFQ